MQRQIVLLHLVIMIHGICHLLVYDHEVPEEKKEMRILEEKILEGCEA